MKPSKRTAMRADRTGRRKKVTYSLPFEVASELDRRASGQPRTKSLMVAEALAFYFAAEDKKALAAIYEEAASDPLFKADNRAVEKDFEVLDREDLPEKPR